MSTNQAQPAAPTLSDRRAADKKVTLSRVYVVKKDGKKRLVRSPDRNRAYGHIYGVEVDACVDVANQSELIHLLSQGIKIEEAVPVQESLA